MVDGQWQNKDMLNHAEIARLLTELEPWTGSVAQRIQQEASESVTISLRRPGKTAQLHLRLARGRLRFYLDEKRPKSLDTPPSFTMALRKHLTGGKLVGLEQPPGERIARFRFARTQGDVVLVAELIPPGGNLLLLDAHEKILARLFNDERNGALGRAYAPPPAGEGAPAAPVRRFEGESLHAHLASLETDQAAAADDKAVAAGERKRQKLLAKLDEDWARAGDPAQWRRQGDALAAQPAPPQADALGRVTITDPATGEPMTIDLQPGLGFAENIEALYKKAKRADSAREHIAARRQRLETEAPMPQRQATAAAPKRAAPVDLPAGHAFRYPGGSLVLVGRSAQENDRISFGFASGDDRWLHARDVPGSHVVVRHAPGDDLESLLDDAARLALHYSFRRGEAAGDVQLSRKKYLQRVKGAPGKVRIVKEENRRVSATPEDLARIEAYRVKRGA